MCAQFYDSCSGAFALMSSSSVIISYEISIINKYSIHMQEITADTRIETPVLGVSKKLMRQHVHNLLSILSPRERRIIKLRYGILDGKPRSLSEIGELYGLSKERVRQLESRALYRLKQSLGSQAVDGYADLLI